MRDAMEWMLLRTLAWVVVLLKMQVAILHERRFAHELADGWLRDTADYSAN